MKSHFAILVFMMVIVSLSPINAKNNGRKNSHDTNPIRFHSLKWGISPEEAKQQMTNGTTLLGEKNFGGGKIVYYKEELLGHSATTGLYFHPDKGLVRGIYRLDMEATNDCQEEFERLKSFISEQYPELHTLKQSISSNQIMGSCQAAMMGEGHHAVMWTRGSASSISEAKRLVEDGAFKYSIILGVHDYKYLIFYETTTSLNWAPKVKKKEYQEQAQEKL